MSRLRLANRIVRQHPGLTTPEMPPDDSPANFHQAYTTTTPEYSPRSDYYNMVRLSTPPRFAREQNLGFLNEFEACDTTTIAERMDNNQPGYMTAPPDVLPLQPTPVTDTTGQAKQQRPQGILPNDNISHLNGHKCTGGGSNTVYSSHTRRHATSAGNGDDHNSSSTGSTLHH
ncbi:unnamed protein product [Sphagnum tenellum]